jgi:hypothetical protein
LRGGIAIAASCKNKGSLHKSEGVKFFLIEYSKYPADKTATLAYLRSAASTTELKRCEVCK